MYNINYIFSWLIAYCLSKNTVTRTKIDKVFVDKIVHKEIIVYKHDPDGLVKQDITDLENIAPKVHFKTGDTLADVAYKQGQFDLITFLKRKHLGE